MLSNIFLSYKAEYLCPLPPEEALTLLAQNIYPRRVMFQSRLRLASNVWAFEGKISGNSFSLSRIIKGNFFAPLVRGTVEPDEAGCRIRLRSGLRAVAALVAYPYFILTGYVWLAAITQMLDAEAPGSGWDGIAWGFLVRPGCFLLAGLLVCVLPHLAERKKALGWLAYMLALEPVRPFDPSRQAI